MLPGGERTRIAAIDTYDGELEEAMAPMSLTLRLEDELDVSRGELICHPERGAGRRARARRRRLLDGRRAAARRRALPAQAHLAQRDGDRRGDRRPLDVHTLERDRARRPSSTLNDIGRVRLRTSAPLAFDPYTSNRRTGSFILIDEATNAHRRRRDDRGRLASPARGDCRAAPIRGRR